MRREAEVRPSSTSSSGITPELRNTAVSWLVEVAAEFQLQQETLFMSVSYFDRFVGLSQVGGGGSAAAARAGVCIRVCLQTRFDCA